MTDARTGAIFGIMKIALAVLACVLLCAVIGVAVVMRYEYRTVDGVLVRIDRYGGGIERRSVTGDWRGTQRTPTGNREPCPPEMKELYKRNPYVADFCIP